MSDHADTEYQNLDTRCSLKWDYSLNRGGVVSGHIFGDIYKVNDLELFEKYTIKYLVIKRIIISIEYD